MPRGLNLSTLCLSTKMAHNHGTDTHRYVFGERLHEDLLPSPKRLSGASC